MEDPEGWEERNQNVGVYVDSAPEATRVAFLLGGIIDNWVGIVYDPTGEVLKINALDPFNDQWHASPITQLFGGDMTSASHIKGHWYLCTFT